MTRRKPSAPPVERLKRDPYAQASVAYVVYGLVYLGGAVAELSYEQRRDFFGFVPWWAFYVVGAGLLALLPALLWRGIRWLAALLCFFTAFKGLWLIWAQARHLAAGEPTRAFRWLFAAVALGASLLLLRAALRRPTWPRRASGASR